MTLDVRTMCLGALLETSASGYELQKNFKEGPLAHFLEASYGSIYPALTRLTDDGMVTCSEHSQEGRPDKKVYSITPEGRDALGSALNAMPAEDKFRSEFLFFVSFSELMTPEHITELIDDRIDTIRNKQAMLSEVDYETDNAGYDFVRGYGQAMMKASLKYLQENRSLVETPSMNYSGAKKRNGGATPSLNQNQWK